MPCRARAKFCTQTKCKTCTGFYVERGRRYHKNDIFLKLRACRPTVLLGLSAGWLQQCAGPLAGWLHAGPLQSRGKRVAI